MHDLDDVEAYLMDQEGMSAEEAHATAMSYEFGGEPSDYMSSDEGEGEGEGEYY